MMYYYDGRKTQKRSCCAHKTYCAQNVSTDPSQLCIYTHIVVNVIEIQNLF